MMRHALTYILIGTLVIFGSSNSMQIVEGQDFVNSHLSVYVKTSDGVSIAIPRWQIEQMRTLSVLLEDQEGKNNLENPISVSMITSQDLLLLHEALNILSKQDYTFEQYWNDFCEKDRLKGHLNNRSFLCPSQRMLINVAQKVEATGLSALCASNFLPRDVQKMVIQDMIEFVISCLDKKSMEKRKVSLKGHSGKVKVVVFGSSNKVVSGGPNSLILWDDINNPKPIRLQGHSAGITSVALSPDSTQLISGSSGGQNNLILWNISNVTNPAFTIFPGHPKSINSVVFSSNGMMFASGCQGIENSLILWDIHNTVKPISTIFPGDPANVLSIAFSPDGTKMVSGSSGIPSNLILWDITDAHKPVSTILAGHQADNVLSVAFSPDGTKMVSGSSGIQNNLILWDIADANKPVSTILAGHPAPVLSVAFSPDGTKMVSGSSGIQSNLILWDITDAHKPISTILVGHPAPTRILSVAFSPDSTKVVSSSWGKQNNLILWDITDAHKPVSTVLAGHPESVTSVAFSPDGTQLVSGSWCTLDNLILWKFLSHKEKITLRNCTIAEAKLLYELCMKSIVINLPLVIAPGHPYYSVMSSLPEDIQDLLKDFFGISSI